jgi:hypothetical protein
MGLKLDAVKEAFLRARQIRDIGRRWGVLLFEDLPENQRKRMVRSHLAERLLIN